MTRAEATVHRRPNLAALGVGTLLCLSPVAAEASPPIEFGAYLGGSFALGESGLGNPYFVDQQPRPSFTLGLRGAWWFRPELSAELAFDYSPTSTVGALTAGRPGISTTLLGAHASGRYTLFARRSLRPFGVFGASVAAYLGEAPTHYALQTPDVDVGLHWGLGLEFDPGLRAVQAVRLDARHLLFPVQDRTYSIVVLNVGVVFELQGGVRQLRQASSQRAASPAPEPQAPILAPPAPAPVSPAAPPVPHIEVLGTLGFDIDSADLREADLATIDQLAGRLRDVPQARLEVEGHTDLSGVEQRNTQLSRRRADAVKWALVDRGVAAGRILTFGFGAERPIAPNDTAEGRARNRRIELRLVVTTPAPSDSDSP